MLFIILFDRIIWNLWGDFVSNILDINDIRVSIVDDDNYSAIPVLSRDEEVELFNLYLSDNKEIRKSARDKIFYSNIRLVRVFTHKYSNVGKLSYDDIFMEGCIGLINAIDRFDISKGYKFSTYATWWICCFILSAINEQSNCIRIPNWVLNKVNMYKALMEKNDNNSFNLTFIDYLRENTELRNEDIDMIEKSLYDVISIDDSLGKKSDIPLREMIRDDIDVEDIVGEKIMLASFHDTIDEIMDKFKVSERDKQIIYYRFGLYGYPVKTLDEIGIIFDMSHQRVYQIVNNFIKKIQNNKECKDKIKVYLKK